MPPRLSTRLALAALLTLFLATPALAEWREVPYADMAKMPLSLKKADPQGVFSYWYVARPTKGTGPLPPGLLLQIKAGEQVTPLAIAADGRVDMPFRQDWADAGAMVRVNQPKGSFQMDFKMIPRVPTGTQMSYGQLTESAAVTERLIKEMAGLMSMFAPKVQTFTLEFADAPQTATLTWPNGEKKVWKTAGNGRINLPWQSDWAPVKVELSAPLKGLGPQVK